MKFKINFQIPKVNLTRFKSELHSHLSEKLAQAGAVWLQATAEGPVPVWSGASRATFQPLASYVGYVLSISPVSDAPNRISLGLSNGTASFEAGTAGTGLYSFTYTTTLPHLIFNEYNNANAYPPVNGHQFHLTHPGPYDFQGKGKRAFQKFARDEVGLPGWSSFIDVTSLRMG